MIRVQCEQILWITKLKLSRDKRKWFYKCQLTSLYWMYPDLIGYVYEYLKLFSFLTRFYSRQCLSLYIANRQNLTFLFTLVWYLFWWKFFIASSQEEICWCYISRGYFQHANDLIQGFQKNCWTWCTWFSLQHVFRNWGRLKYCGKFIDQFIEHTCDR